MIHIFIINPYAGRKNFADDLRSRLESVEGLNYFVFNTRYAGYETELVKKILHIFEGEQLRFYACGGSGTMRNIMNGFDDLSKAELAFYPCGMTNDFLKVFGSDMNRFYDIEELINGDVIKVDYISTNCGVCLNTVSMGLDSNVCHKMEQYRIMHIFNENLPYDLATFYAFFISSTEEYEITTDEQEYCGRFAEIFFGNGCVLGGNLRFAETTSPTDGKALVSFIGNYRNLQLLPYLIALTGRKYERYGKLMTQAESETIRFRRRDGGLFCVNFDGELVKDVSVLEAHIVHNGLNFVVPKGVTR